MGSIYTCKCNKCGFSYEAWTGVGFLFPKVYEETVNKMKAGEYGPQGKDFFEAFPNGAITCDNVVIQCTRCHKLSEVPELTMYIPNNRYDPQKINENKVPWSTAFSFNNKKYVSSGDLNKYYTEFEKYDHKCPECNGKAVIVPGFTDDCSKGIDRHVVCPQCSNILDIHIWGKWD